MLQRLSQLDLHQLLALALAGWTVDTVRTVLGLYEQVLHTDLVLVLVAVTLHFADLPLGLYRGLTHGGGFRLSRFEPRKAGNWAGNLIKYFLAVAVCVLIANGTSHVPGIGVVFSGLDEAALLAVIVLNGSSVLGHLLGGRGGVRAFFGRVGMLGAGTPAGRAAEAIIDLVEPGPEPTQQQQQQT